MIVCPNSQHKNVAGALFCAECGAQLDGVETLVTQAITDEQIAEDLKKKSMRPEGVSTPANSWISLHLMDSGKILPLASRNEFTLGRLSEGQPIMPDMADIEASRTGAALRAVGLDARVRAEELDPGQWRELAQRLLGSTKAA